ncbi:MAG: WecB/TagA/CpsF family glycosyltransferase [Anaerolineae bacterium]|nr:WecB/TagA/CpsF family glycosyltransferase [Anaerolineae bacterium]
MDTPPRVNILGVGISAINMEQALAIIDDWIARRDPHYVCVSTVHGVMECQQNQAVRRALNSSGLTTPDGMPLVWISRLRGFRHVRRVYGPDLMLAVCERSVVKGYRHYLYGGQPGVAEALKARLERRFPGVQIVGLESPPFEPLTPEQDREAVERINAANPDIVWVGMSTPKQDLWAAEHVGRLKAPVILAVGAAFDFVSGRKRQAPRWMRDSGLEWLFRLIQEPRRLWRRYLIYNPIFVWLLLGQVLGLRKYTLD